MPDRSSDSHGHARPDTVLPEDVPPDPVPVQIAPEQWYQFYTKYDKDVQGPYTLHDMREEMRAILRDTRRSRGSEGPREVEVHVRCSSGPTRRESWRALGDDLPDIHDPANYFYEMKVSNNAVDGHLTVNGIRETIEEGLYRGALPPVLVRKCEPRWGGDWGDCREAGVFDELMVTWYQWKGDMDVEGPYTLHLMQESIAHHLRSKGSEYLRDAEVRCFSGPPPWEDWAPRESWGELGDDLLGHAAVDIDDHLANYLYEMKVCDDGPLTVNSIRERIVELGLHRGALSPVLVRKCEPSWGDWREAVLFDELIPEALKLLEKARMLTRDHRWGEAIEACDNGLAICGTEDPQLTSDLETAKRIACLKTGEKYEARSEWGDAVQSFQSGLEVAYMEDEHLTQALRDALQRVERRRKQQEALKFLKKAKTLTLEHRWGEAIEACENGLAIRGTEDPQLTSDLETAKRIACGGSKEQCKQRLRRGSCALLVVLLLLLLWWLVPPDPGDCFGNWSVCGSDCIKIYTVHVEAEDGGSGCAHDHGASEVCQPGQGGCPPVSEPPEPPEPLEPGPEPECGCGGNNDDGYGILQSLLEDDSDARCTSVCLAEYQEDMDCVADTASCCDARPLLCEHRFPGSCVLSYDSCSPNCSTEVFNYTELGPDCGHVKCAVGYPGHLCQGLNSTGFHRVEVRLVGLEYDAIRPDEIMAEFKKNFTDDIVEILNISRQRVAIETVRAGSVVVVMAILPCSVVEPRSEQCRDMTPNQTDPDTLCTEIRNILPSHYDLATCDSNVEPPGPPPVNCSGSWSECGADCANKTYTVHVEAEGQGTGCRHSHGASEVCRPGEGACTRDWTMVDWLSWSEPEESPCLPLLGSTCLVDWMLLVSIILCLTLSVWYFGSRYSSSRTVTFDDLKNALTSIQRCCSCSCCEDRRNKRWEDRRNARWAGRDMYTPHPKENRRSRRPTLPLGNSLEQTSGDTLEDSSPPPLPAHSSDEDSRSDQYNDSSGSEINDHEMDFLTDSLALIQDQGESWDLSPRTRRPSRIQKLAEPSRHRQAASPNSHRDSWDRLVSGAAVQTVTTPNGSARVVEVEPTRPRQDSRPVTRGMWPR